MPTWLRAILAVIGGFVVWFMVATVGNFGIRWFFPGYTEVEKAMSFSLGMLVARLVLGAVASAAAGAACMAFAKQTNAAIYLFGLLLVALFVPVHVGLWTKFPVWYHIVFLGSLFPLVVLGAKLLHARGARATNTGK